MWRIFVLSPGFLPLPWARRIAMVDGGGGEEERRGGGRTREEVFRDEDTGRAWEWRAVKDNRRPVKGSEEQDAMLVPRSVARCFGAVR